MLTRLIRTELGPMTLDAPEFPPRQATGEHGHLWQWVGDGGELVSLSVAVRQSRLVSERGVRDHLNWEVRELAETLDADHESRVSFLAADVSGAPASAAATVDGMREGHALRSHLVVTTDGARHQYVIHALVPDNRHGREMSTALTTAIMIYPWTMPV